MVEGNEASDPNPLDDAADHRSDYGDFASDEEEILTRLLSQIEPTSATGDPPLLVIDIEDYEAPQGVRLPKVLGLEKRDFLWLSQGERQNTDERARDGVDRHGRPLDLFVKHFCFTDSLTSG